MILSSIAAMARNRVIGIDNKLPWNIPEDLKFFRDKTRGKILIMGRKTFESLGGKPLPGRPHIVITRQRDYHFDHPLVQIVPDLKSAVAAAKKLIGKYDSEVMICGGGEIYSQSMDIIDRLYLTVIDQEFEGDAKFPEFDQNNFEISEKKLREGYCFYTFDRKR